MTELIPCLWFDGNAQEAAEYYASFLPNSHIDETHRAAADYPDGKKGDPLTVEFTLLGRKMTGLNGGPHFTFSEAISFQLICDDQDEVDRYWEKLSAHSGNEQCGWCKDKFGLSWQIIPRRLLELMASKDPGTAEKAMKAMLQMKKLDIAGLEAAVAK